MLPISLDKSVEVRYNTVDDMWEFWMKGYPTPLCGHPKFKHVRVYVKSFLDAWDGTEIPKLWEMEYGDLFPDRVRKYHEGPDCLHTDDEVWPKRGWTIAKEYDILDGCMTFEEVTSWTA